MPVGTRFLTLSALREHADKVARVPSLLAPADGGWRHDERHRQEARWRHWGRAFPGGSLCFGRYWLFYVGVCAALGLTGELVALVVLLRGVNVGGHRRFQPLALAKQLKHLDAMSIGAAGTFVIRRPVTRAQLRAEIARRLPFDAEIVICEGREIVSLISRNPFANVPARPGVVRFVSVLSRHPRSAPSMPMSFPSTGKWLLKVLVRDKRFVVGQYRRHMKVIGILGSFDRVFGVPTTTRSWSTISAISKALHEGGA